MTVPDVAPTDAWLSSGRMDTSPAPGKLALKDDRLTFTVTAPGSDRNARWVEEATGQQGVAERILNGETVTVIDCPVAQANAKFTASSMGSTLLLTVDGTKYRISFFDTGKAVGRPWRSFVGTFTGAGKSKPFRDALKGL